MAVALRAAAGITLDLDGPLPREPFYSLIKSLRAMDGNPPALIEGEDGRWLNGVAVYGFPQTLPETWDPCSAGTFREKAEGEDVPTPRFDAFGIYLPITCSTFGMGNWQLFRERARIVLEATRSHAIEQVLISGVDLSTNVNPFAGDTNVNIVGGGAVTPNVGLSWLEHEIAASGQQGIIHAPPEVAVQWPLELFPDGTMRTKAGTLVVIGTGYSDAEADGNPPAAGQSYAFATGMVQVRLSEISFAGEDLNGVLDTLNNVVTYRAEQFALVMWNGLPQANPDILQAAAVLIDWTP